MKLARDLLAVLRPLIASREGKIASTGIILALLYTMHHLSTKTASKYSNIKQSKRTDRGSVNYRFFTNLWELVKIAVPSATSKEAVLLYLLSGLLVVRTLISVSLAAVAGAMVKAIVTRDLKLFLKNIGTTALYAIPATTINSALDYLNSKLAIMFRTRLTHHLNDKYLSGLIFYQITNLDSRVTNPDQRLTQDIEKWANCLSALYSNLTKPLLDIVFFSKKLADLVGWEGPALIIGWYFISGLVMRYISPPFGLLTAQEQQNEGLYRSCQSELVNNAEEIAFYRGNKWEKRRVSNILKVVVEHIKSILGKRYFMGIFDSMLTKYGATMVSYTVLGLPVFSPKREKYQHIKGMDTGNITRDYIRNSSLLINLTKAIGRLVVSYKDLQSLSGYTTLIHELKVVLDDLEKKKYIRTMLDCKEIDYNKRGNYYTSDFIEFIDVPIVSPNGDLLIKSLSFKIEPGMHTFIQGPNGCGKSSLFRILGELWPLFSGIVHKPPKGDIFYIPQKPFLPHGTLRDQIIYPDSVETMKKKGLSDSHLEDLMKVVKLEEIINKRGGFEQVEEWNDTLSGGQKQRIAICRLLYHKPKFAILDECSSAVSIDAEGVIYEHFKSSGITLITVSHRESLMKYHNHVLKIDGEGGWKFIELVES